MSKLTISTVVEQQGKCMQQTGAFGRFAKVTLRLEPRPELPGIEFVNAVTDLPHDPELASYCLSGVEKGIRDFAARNAVGAMRITLIAMSFQPVDSTELSFKLAATQAMEEAFARYGIREEAG